MILETAQLLCGPIENAPYKRTHFNHPCAIWTRKSAGNYKWLLKHGVALCEEYTHRYGKIHKSQAVIEWCQKNIPSFKEKNFTPPPLCMPNQYKEKCYILSYRNYYKNEKMSFARWKKD